MKKPKDCISIDEIRIEIDSIDKQIIGLVGERFQYIKEIVRFKKDKEDVQARERYDQVLEIRRKWAEEEGLNPDVIEQVYKMLMQYFIVEQKRMLKID
jgi:isochorismate pyruvate lyase